MKPLCFAPSVEAEIEAAGDYYEDQQSGLGSEFLDALEDPLQRLVEQPHAHGLVPDTESEEEIRQVVSGGSPYRIVFRERAEDLLVPACMHARGEPGYWRARDQD